MKIFPSEIIREIDAYTIDNEPISSVDLMERAAKSLFDVIIGLYPKDKQIVVFAGPGNNGGDGLALARMLHHENYSVETYLVAEIAKLSEDCRINYERLHLIDRKHVKCVKSMDDFPELSSDFLIVDALFGTGLKRPLEGIYKDLVQLINKAASEVIAIDVPSGLFSENNRGNNRDAIIQADLSISFQFPKLAFLLAENEAYVGDWKLTDIGLHSAIIKEKQSQYKLVDEALIAEIYKPRKRFSHKGTFGHALLLAGSYCKMGAAVLASRGCLHSGVGLLTTHCPKVGYKIMQVAVPEAMVCVDRSDILLSEFPDLNGFKAVGIGPGIGTKSNTVALMDELLDKACIPMVIDADGLNILSQNKDRFSKLPKETILTPHPGEFERMAGPFKDDYDQLQKAIGFAKQFGIVLVLKGAYTAIIDASGHCCFNNTGNSGMATPGSGDVLTGIICGLLAQGYAPINAAILGVWVHGLAADCYVLSKGAEALCASDIVTNLGNAFRLVSKYK